jgi:hypothetical protein
MRVSADRDAEDERTAPAGPPTRGAKSPARRPRRRRASSTSRHCSAVRGKAGAAAAGGLLQARALAVLLQRP